MDVLFINPTEKCALNQEVNGTMLLATKLLLAGFDVDVLRFYQIKSFNDKNYEAFIAEIVENILARGAKCVSFYTLWLTYHVVLRIAKEVKERSPQTVIVMGGPQASATAEETLRAVKYVDYICTGEGEETVVPFFRAVLSSDPQAIATVPGLYYRKDGEVVLNHVEVPMCDLNTLPYWDDRLYLPEHGRGEEKVSSDTYFMPIDAGRGCPYSCTFCCTSHFWKRMYRLKSPERIVEDIRHYNEAFGINSFWGFQNPLMNMYVIALLKMGLIFDGNVLPEWIPCRRN